MEFWGVEVKNGETLPVKKPTQDKLIHISQACVGETKKEAGSELIRLYARKKEKKYLIGVLSYDKLPHLNFDLVFEDDFELFHDSKYGSVHLAGYVADSPDMADDDDVDSEDMEDATIPFSATDNGKVKADEKPTTETSKNKVKIAEANKDAKKKEKDDDSDEEDDSDEDEDSDDDEMENAKGESDKNEEDSSDGDEEESEEETPKKTEVGKKRPAEASNKTPASDKKAKFVTPQKTDGKKAPHVHIATPYPTKKTPANNEKSKQQTPKSGSGSFSCSTCNKNFGSDQALLSHSKAKHGAGK